MKHTLRGALRSKTFKYLVAPLGVLGPLAVIAEPLMPNLLPVLGPRQYGIAMFLVACVAGYWRLRTNQSLADLGKTEQERLEDAAHTEH